MDPLSVDAEATQASELRAKVLPPSRNTRIAD